MSRNAKIVCTLGPAVGDHDAVARLVEAGMDVARLNFSHGSHEDHARAYTAVRQTADASGRAVGVMADLQGPKIRLGTFTDGKAVWRNGARVVITTEDVAGRDDRVSTTYGGLADDVHPHDRLLVDDGNIALEVEEVDGPDVVCRVTEGGPVSDHKGISLPGIDVRVEALTDKDVADLRFALTLRVDMVALSFVRKADDVLPVRRILAEVGAEALGVIAKIEKPEAVEHLEEIVEAFDGIMVARGDLGVEMALEQVPLVQKRAITMARRAGKPVVVATQLLDSMIAHSRPTRAEVSDVANAVFDGTDALMLSGETSVGDHPVDSVRTMARIVAATEREEAGHYSPAGAPAETRSAALARAAVDVAADVDACALVAFTESGGSARRLARHRPVVPLLAFTPHPLVRSQLALTWGVETFIVPAVETTDEMVRQVDEALQRLGRAKPGDSVVLVAGMPAGVVGTTNMIRVHRIGE